MPETFTFELVSPEKVLFSGPALMVTAPGENGEYGVLPGHAPMITMIKPGVIKVFTTDLTAPSSRLFVAGGFAEVTQSRFTILADEAIQVSDLNAAELAEQAKELAGKLTTANESQRAILQAQHEVVTAKLAAAS